MKTDCKGTRTSYSAWGLEQASVLASELLQGRALYDPLPGSPGQHCASELKAYSEVQDRGDPGAERGE